MFNEEDYYSLLCEQHDILDKIGKAATYEQLAEEATELAHAALKYARVLRNENPTSTDEFEAARKVREEFTDLLIMSDQLDLAADMQLYSNKLNRFEKRWKEKIGENESENPGETEVV